MEFRQRVTKALISPIYPDNRLKVRIRHARLVPQELFGSGMHCGKKHLDVAAEALPIKMPSKLFSCSGTHEIHERVPFASLAVEGNRQAQIVVKPRKTCLIKLLNNLFDVVLQGFFLTIHVTFEPQPRWQRKARGTRERLCRPQCSPG